MGCELDETGAGGPTKWGDVTGGRAEGLGVERRGKRTIDFRGKLYLAPLTTVSPSFLKFLVLRGLD